MNNWKKLLRVWTTWWTVPIVALLIYWSPDIIQALDETSAPIHVDFWQHVLFAALITLLMSELSFGYLAFNHPNLFKWYVEKFDDSEHGSPWLVFAYLALIMVVMALVLTALV